MFQLKGRTWHLISDEAKDLVHRMLELDPERRITIEEAVRHPWFVKVKASLPIITHVRLVTVLYNYKLNVIISLHKLLYFNPINNDKCNYKFTCYKCIFVKL